MLTVACEPQPVEPNGGPDLAVTAATETVLIGAGDIATCTKTTDEATASLVDSLLAKHPGAAVFAAGDNVYEDGTAQEYTQCYQPSWGRFKDRTWAVIGNHEYQVSPDPTWDYFGTRIGPRGLGYYSVDVGNWHLVMLNSNTGSVPATAGSPQDTWLRGDLAANTKQCVMAIFHHARFYSSDTQGAFTSSGTKPFWDALYQYGADVVVVGHHHHYERFAPQDPDGKLDLARGMRQFIVGTGGRSVGTKDFQAPNSEVRNNQSVYGVIKFTLYDTSYKWEFLPIAGYSFRDSGTGTCNGGGGGGGVAPTANFTWVENPTGTVAFTDASSDADGAVTGWSWNFGDGATATAQNPTHTYASAGTYTVTLTVTDNDGLPGSTSAPVTVTPPGPSGPFVDVRVAASSDDAEESSTGSVSLTSSDLEMVFDGSDQTVGMRFNAVTIPRGATITSAHVQFQVDASNSVATSLTIRGQAADNAATFTSATGNVSSRIRTAAAVSWTPPAWTSSGLAGADQRTPNLAGIVQEIVDRPAWASGNSLAIIITGTGERTAEAYDGVPSAAPLLHVEYSTESSTNTAPTASNVSITGTPQVGEVLTGDYTYADADGDAEGTSTYRWLRNGTAIGGAGARTYPLVAADQGALIVFEVTPVAATGASPGAAAQSAAVGPVVAANTAPTASSVTITGSAQIGQVLTGNYTYSDADGDLEGTSTYRWLRNGGAISGATAKTYTPVAADQGTLIVFEVTPVAATGASTGAAVQSAAVEPVAATNAAPTAGSVNITGTAQVGQVLTGNYTYSDVDGDLEATSTYRWLRNGGAISSATAKTYTLIAADQGALIVFEVTPRAATGTSPGAAVQSAAAGPVKPANTAPTASNVTITGTVEVGQVLTGNYTYSDADGDAEGASTYRWLRNGAAITGAVAQTYPLVAADQGALIVFEVTPVAATGASSGVASQSSAAGPVAPASPLAVTAISPNTIVLGTTIDVTVTGSGFAAGATLTFENGSGPTPTAANVVVVDGQTITARVTAKVGGPPRDRLWTVRVTNPSGWTGTLVGGLTVRLAP